MSAQISTSDGVVMPYCCCHAILLFWCCYIKQKDCDRKPSLVKATTRDNYKSVTRCMGPKALEELHVVSVAKSHGRDFGRESGWPRLDYFVAESGPGMGRQFQEQKLYMERGQVSERLRRWTRITW